jgi:hypothetical protein
MTAALAAMTGAIEGVKAGDETQFKQANDAFKQNYDEALKNYEAMMKEQDSIIKDKSLDLTAKDQLLKIAAARHGQDWKRVNMPWETQMKLYASERKSYDQAVAQREKFEESLAKQREWFAMQRSNQMALAAATGRLASSDGENEALIEGIASGRINPNVVSTRNNQRARVMEQVAERYPDYDQTALTSRTAAQRDFSSGVTGRNITAIDTAIGHLGTMNQLADAMKNGDVKALNSLYNRLATETGQPEINNFDIAKGAVANELMRVFRQVGASEVETAEWEKKFANSSSPEQIKGATKTAGSLLGSRIDAIDNQWKRAMRTDKSYPNMLSPKSVSAMKEMGVSVPVGTTSSSTLTEKDKAAISWAKAHPDDKRAKDILALHPGA